MAITAAAAVATVLLGLGLASTPPAAQTSVVAPALSCPPASGSC